MSDSSILHNFPQWERINKELEDDPYNDKLWSDLVSHHEKLIADHITLLRSRRELKSLLYADFDKLLTKFPYYTKYWKKYIKIVNNLEGLHPSAEIMKRSVVIFPYSLDLWVDYMSAVLVNKLQNDNEIIKNFTNGSEKVGYHFLAHEFWDMYLNWARGKYGSNSIDYINVLSKVVEIPLHQYAKYNEEFTKLCQNFTVVDLVKKEKLIKFINLKNLNSENENIDEFIENNSATLIDRYYSEVLLHVQQRAQEKWKFESKVKMDFNLVFPTNEELNDWNSYLQYEEDFHKSREQIENNPELTSLFERALIPMCFIEQIWIKYNRYLIQNKGDQFKIILNFNKACDHFVPLDQKDIRYMYVKYLDLKMNNLESCKTIFISMIEKAPTDCEIVSNYIEFLVSHEPEYQRKELFEDLINSVHLYNQKINEDNHQNKKKKVGKLSNENLKIKSKDIVFLNTILNFWTIGQLIINVCRHTWLIEKDIKHTRDILMGIFGTEAVKSNRGYWFFFFKFELSQRNKKNLSNIINHVKTSTTLNTSDINLLIDEYNSFIFKNFTVTEMKNNERDIIKNILETDFQSSMHMKHFLKIRLAGSSDVDLIDKRIIKENGHPSASCEGRPVIINPILITDNMCHSKEPHPLPKFRNVEKASLNVKYVHESL